MATGSDPPIHHAASAGDVHGIQDLLGRDPSLVNATGWMGAAPLHEAAVHGQTEAARLLIAHGADVNARREHGITPLHWAGNAEIAQLLIAAGAFPDEIDGFGQTPLHEAVERGDLGTITLLLRYDTRVNALSTYTGTPLHGAAKRGDIESARTLLAAGADVNAVEPRGGTTPLHQAIAASQDAMVRFLVSQGARVDLRNALGQTALHLAQERKQGQLLAFLRAVAPPTPPVVLTARELVATALCAPAGRAEVLTTARHAIMARWGHNGAPHLLAARQTDHARLPALACRRDAATCIVAVPLNALEEWGWDDLEWRRRITLPPVDEHDDTVEASALAVSPDGRWLAVADTVERVYLIDYASGVAGAAVEAGERTGAVAFDPSSRVLATACSFQGGGHVRVDRVEEQGLLTPLYELGRSHVQTPSAEFVDTLAHLAFSASGRYLGLFETSAIDYAFRPIGWRGNLVVFDMANGALLWQASIDAAITGERTWLDEAGYDMGFETTVLFLGDERVLCGATSGRILIFRTGDGTLARTVQVPTRAAVHALAATPGLIWILLSDGTLHALPLTDLR